MRSNMWYEDKVGQSFDFYSHDTEFGVVWVRTGDSTNSLNWIYESECEII